MAQQLQNSWITTSIPGSYANVEVVSNPSGLGTTGVITIIGEASGGPSYSEDILKDNFFSPAQADLVRAKYLSGNIVDAMQALVAPSADANIQGAPTRIYIVKTNTGLQAQATVDTNYGTLVDSNYGLNGNNIKYQVTESIAELVPTITSDTIPALATSDPTPQIQTIVTGTAVGLTTISGGQYLEFQAGNLGVEFYAWFTVDAVGVDPAIAGKTALPIAILSSDVNSAVATKIAAAINTAPFNTSFSAAVSPANTVTITNLVNGEAASIVNVNVAGAVVAVVQYGGLSDGSLLNGVSFSLRINGASSATVTLSNNEEDHDSVAELVNELNSLLPAGITATAGTANATIVLSMAVDAANYRKGWGKSFELVDSTSGDLAALGLDAGLSVSATESDVELNVVNQTQNVSQSLNASGQIGFRIGYDGTTALMTIGATTLTTAVTGGSGANLSLVLSQYATVADLAAFISTQTGYSASATTVATQSSPSTLDRVTSIGICSTEADIEAGRVKQALYRFSVAAAQSAITTFTAIATAGLATPTSGFIFLLGGTTGGTTNANILDGIARAESVQTNFIVPLFSQNASVDISEGLTASSSTYTIASVNAIAKTHVIKMSTPALKHYRQALCSFEGTFIQAKDQAQDLSSFRCALAFQKASQVNSLGEVTSFAPWFTACTAAAMQAAGFYKSITNKYANVISYTDPTGFDSTNPGSLENALQAGLLILQADNAGNRWISDQNSYSYDANFVYNSIQAVYLSDVATLGLIDGTQRTFVGQANSDVSAGDVRTFVQSLMAQYKINKIIAPSDGAPLGYRNLTVSISGPVINIGIELLLNGQILFVALDISIAQVQQTA